jgi:hypothetical protein
MHKTNRSAACALAALGLAMTTARAAEYSAPQIRLPFLQTAPTIDGVIKADEWQGAARMEGFGRPAPLAPMMASFWVGATEKELFIAVQSEAPPGGKLLARVNPAPAETDARAYLDDSVEIIFDPLRHLGADKTGKRKLFQLITNAKGAIFDQAYSLSGGGEAWRGAWRIANKIEGDRWNCEIAIPWSSFGATADDLKQPIGLRVGRNWQQTALASQTEWSPLGGPYMTPETMPVVAFDASAPVVQVLALRDESGQKAEPQVSLFNPGNAPRGVLLQLNVVPKNSAPTQHRETLTLAPGETKTIAVPAAGTAEEELFTEIRVSSPDEKTVYYQRNFSWSIGRSENLWTLDADAAKKIDTSFAFFPSHHAMKVKVNLSGLEEKAKVTAVNLAVRAKADKKQIAATKMPPLQKDVTQLDEWKLPPLSEGEYELVVTLDGLKVEPQVLPFVRHKFAWEGNALGKSDIVVPPFTPIVVAGQNVQTVLREHAMNGLGLWNQVVADGQKLLRAPMRLEAKSGGRVLAASGQPVSFSEKKATRAVAQASWSAGALRGSTRSEWDYDGVMKSTLTLQPTTEAIDSLTLVIPLDDKAMPLMHTCTDGLRFNYAGSTPAGEGIVWDGSKAARNSIIGTYVPYIWLGGQERGLSVFGDNDKGWITDDKTPCQQIVRKADGTLELRLNLISTPTKISAARQIVLGFQATPVKPMPQNWRLWTVGARGGVNPPGSYHQAFLGSGWYWGTLTAAADIYPRKQDFSLYDEFAKTRKTGEIDKAFLEKWLAGYPQPDVTTPQNRRNHINGGFNQMKQQPDGVLCYTNGRGVRLDTPEGQTFLDEWHRDAFTKRDWPFGGATYYDLDPVESYRDYAMFYYKKMYDTFDDAIYWDDIFLQSDFDTIGTAAYVRPDGNVQPSAGLWDMRALIRRAMVFGQEEGKINGNMVHMTNTAIAPILSFARTQADWEDRSGDADFQDRFSRDFLQTESIGRQFGNVPIVLNLIRGSDEAKLDWAYRTCAGVMLTHELKPWGRKYGKPDPFWENTDRLRAFGYGTPQVKVWNYWQSDFPAKISGETSSLLLSKPGSTLLIVCDYGDGGDYKVKLDAGVLGLKGKLTAKDAESGAALAVSPAGEIAFNLKKHDFKVIEVVAP